jgi:hypothetical protein|tara:strand:+ start:2938 stop:3210 length:273 start_codon:yes stop_codon:yes gene_type:complete
MERELKPKIIGDFRLRFRRPYNSIFLITQIENIGLVNNRRVNRFIVEFPSKTKKMAIKKSRKIIDDYIEQQIAKEKTETLISSAQSSGLA